MNGCEEVREILVAMGRGERVSAPGQRFLREHVETCPECRRRLENERMLSAGLAAVAAESGGPPAAVKDALLAEFRRQKRVVPIRRPAARWIAVAAVAAASLAAVFWPKGERMEKVVVPVKPPSVVVAKVTPPVVKPVVEKAPSVMVRRKVTGRAKAHPTPVEETPEVATDFFEIPYVEPLRPEQRADVFRIEVPRASMAAFGLPVAGGRLDSRINADVLMGEDGVVRAVRFIR